jgi:ATP-binding cassette subfamily B protein
MESKMSIVAVLKAYWPYVRAYKGWVFLTYLGACLGVACQLVTPWFYKELLDTLAANLQDPSKADLLWILLNILFWNLGGWISYRVGGFVVTYVQPIILANMDRKNLEFLLGHSYQFFTNNFAGSLLRKIQRFSRGFERIMDETEWNLCSLFITLVMAVGALFLRNATLAWATMAFILVVVIGNYFFYRWKLKFDLKRAEKDTEVSGSLADVIGNAVNVKLFSGYGFEKTKFFNVTDQLRRLQYLTWSLGELNNAFQAFMGLFLEFGVMFLAVHLWQKGSISIGDVILVQGYLIAVIGRIWNVGRIMKNLYEAFSDAQEMVDVLQKPYDVLDVKNAKRLKVEKGKLEFAEVSFNYNQTREILKGFDLAVKPGERVALVGPSGAGKSTIVKLLLRFYDLDGGKIMIDGQDIKKVTQVSLRDQIALVPQDPFLFHRTVMDNIRYGRRDASDKEVEQAAKLAHCHEFIEKLPNGYETFVGERGIKLSGGERQRVAIARAILANAPILVLDEATSSLDSESEAYIQDALKNLMKGKTVLVIAHRLSTIMQMDRIVVVEDGRAVDQGSHQQLLAREGLYQKLWTIQAGGFIS